ncbi:hypothetical protein [Pseudomonas sp. Marseille-Q5115]|uniref:hypothetical protein n=1 Tax=Pseudomonas sp. Marseille-Q5115 TaxID=2866593 RepID=UPI001CE3FDD6|nr:hypothetical protein [Pseudomonas sp. Marseille-Q5115]
MPDALNLKIICRKIFIGISVILLIAPWGNPFYWTLWIMVTGLNFAWTLHLIYRNENYTTYMLTLLGCILFIPTYLSTLALYIGQKESAAAPETMYLSMMAPYLITAIATTWFAMKRTTSSPFYCDDGKALIFDYAEPPSTMNQILSVVAFTAGATAIENIGGATAWLLMSGVMLVCTLYFIYQGRHFIAGLRDLIKEERSSSMRYTFFQIEEIREARRRWWISRFARWLENLLKSPPSS